VPVPTHFHQDLLRISNANQQQSCLPSLRKCTTLVFGDLEVFKENFVERGKVLTGSKVQGVL
jgi:hypothetical protein